jgi:aerobic-type carbon monoxide dehydrogenase small subunit (CoxS/CutS family)
VSSCLVLAANAAGHEITTIEGLSGPDGSPGRVQAAFLEAQAFQCGYCTPGMICAVEGLLREEASPDEATARDYLSGNLCRCGTYSAVLEAVAALAGHPD